MTRSQVQVLTDPPHPMTAYKKDKSLRLAAAAVSITLMLGLSGVLWVKSGVALAVLIGLQAVLLIGTGVILGRTSKDKGH